MSRCRFVQPKIARLPLSDGDWIEVKQSLNVGEWFDMFASVGETKMRRDLVRAQIVAYLVEWSLRDPDGQPVPFSAAALGHLDIETYREIDDAIAAHINGQEASKSDPKAKDGETTSVPISPSVVSSI